MQSIFISTFDLLGNKPYFYIKQRKRFSSLLTAWMTLLVGIGYFSVIVYFIAIYLKGYGMTVISSIENVSTPLKIDLNNKVFMFRLSDLSDSIDPRIAYLNINLIRHNNGLESLMNYPLEPCQYDVHFPKDNLIHLFGGVNISQYYCINPTNNITMTYNNSDDSGTYFSLLVSECKNSSSQVCLPKEEIDYQLTYGQFYLTFMIENHKIDHFNQSHPVIKTDYSSTMIILPNEKVDVNIFCKHVEYKSNRGLLWDLWHSEEYYQFDHSLLSRNSRHEGDWIREGSFASFNFKPSPSVTNKYEREYPKITSVLVEITAIGKMIIVLGEFVVEMFNIGVYYSSLFITSKISIENTLQVMCAHKKENKTRETARIHVNVRNYLHHKVNYCTSAQWQIYPRMNKKTMYVDLLKKVIAKYLSVDMILKKISLLDSMSKNVPIQKQGKLSAFTKHQMPASNLNYPLSNVMNNCSIINSSNAFKSIDMLSINK